MPQFETKIFQYVLDNFENDYDDYDDQYDDEPQNRNDVSYMD